MTAAPSDRAKAERVQPRLRPDAIARKLRRLPGWEYIAKRKVISRTYGFPTFLAGIRFVDYVAELAEAADHHPDMDVRYSRVVISVSTHSAGGVTDKDIELARRIDHRT